MALYVLTSSRALIVYYSLYLTFYCEALGDFFHLTSDLAVKNHNMLSLVLSDK